MSELTTYCSDCSKNHTIECTDARKNSWCCPDYVKKMTKHEKHVKKIADYVYGTMCRRKSPSELYEKFMELKEGISNDANQDTVSVDTVGFN